MARHDDPVLPTDFAIKLCEQCLIIPKKVAGGKNVLEIEKVKLVIADFQRLACCAPIEMALIAFTGYKLDEKQKEMLNIVYTSTKPFILGLTLDACLQAVTHKYMSKSEYAEAIKTITDIVKPKDNGAGGDSPRMKGILIKINQKA